MHKNVSSVALALISATARETDEFAGLDALSTLLGKLEESIDFVSQPEHMDAARAEIKARKAYIKIKQEQTKAKQAHD